MTENDYGTKKFLVVDHIDYSRNTLKQLIYNLGASHIDSAFNASEVIPKCLDVTYDIIFLGYDLGDRQKNGQQLLEELRLKSIISRQSIIIMITAEVSQAMVLAALEHKPDDYIAKPYTSKELTKRIERSFAKKNIMSLIYDAMDANDSSLVLELCDKAIRSSSAYKNECLGIKSRQHFDLQQFDQAKKIYLTYNDKKNCQWATIGLGKIALYEEKLEEAVECFQNIINEYPLYLSAYDWLAKTYQQMGEQSKAETILEQALLISPRSVSRIKKYAEMCTDSENYNKATEAYYQTNELSYHSVHRDPDNAIKFVESILEYSEDLPLQQTKNLTYKAFNVLKNMSNDFVTADLKVLTQLLSARLYGKIKETSHANDIVYKAEKFIERRKKDISPRGMLKVSKNLLVLKRNKKAHEILTQLALDNKEDVSLLAEIDSITGQSLTKKDKVDAQNALEIGMNLYKTKRFIPAIEKLNQALNLFPLHTGIKLNLLQVLLVAFEESNDSWEFLEQARELIEQLRTLTSQKESYKRYMKLRVKYELLSNKKL